MQDKPKFEIEEEKESVYASTGYVRHPTLQQIRQRPKRAPQPSPLLQEYISKQFNNVEKQK